MGSKPSGENFLAEVDKRQDVHKLPSGLRFKIITKVTDASQAQSPRADDSCSVHYHGTLTDGTVFDSSMNRNSPAVFAPTQVIRGWTEALQLMCEGEEWEVYLPSDLAYGSSGAGAKIPPNATLVFKIRLLKVLRGGKPGTEAHHNLEKALHKSYADL